MGIEDIQCISCEEFKSPLEMRTANLCDDCADRFEDEQPSLERMKDEWL